MAVMQRIFEVAGGVILIAAGWQLLHWIGERGQLRPPSIFEVCAALPSIAFGTEIWIAAWQTLVHVVISILLAVVVGISLGLVLFSLHTVRGSIKFAIDFARSIPVIILFYLFYSLAVGNQIMLIGGFLSLPFAIFCYGALSAADERFRRMRRAYRLGAWTYWMHVLVPSAAVNLLSGVRVIVSWAVVLVIVFEMFTARFVGVGTLVYDLFELADDGPLGAVVVLVGAFGYCLNAALSWIPSTMAES